MIWNVFPNQMFNQLQQLRTHSCFYELTTLQEKGPLKYQFAPWTRSPPPLLHSLLSFMNFTSVIGNCLSVLKQVWKQPNGTGVIKDERMLIGNKADFTFLLARGSSLSFIFPSHRSTFYLKLKWCPFVLNGGASSSTEEEQKSAIFLLRSEKEAFSSDTDNEGFDCISWQWDGRKPPSHPLYPNCEGQRG